MANLHVSKVNKEQLNLGELIDLLEQELPGRRISFDRSMNDLVRGAPLQIAYPARPNSYRGFYEHLALDISADPITVGEVLEFAKQADGGIFYGYKGGDFDMDRNTPMWVAEYGRNSGIIITGVSNHFGVVKICTADFDLDEWYDRDPYPDVKETVKRNLNKWVYEAGQLRHLVRMYVPDNEKNDAMVKSIEAVLDTLQAEAEKHN